MDNIVIALIAAGVCCFVVGMILFLRLCKNVPVESDPKNLLDPEYAENFNESFKNTGNIEDTLEDLSNIYMNNQYMYNLIVNAMEYIREGQGDYETALDSINVDGDIEIMKIHTAAIKKVLGVGEPEMNAENKDTEKDEDLEEDEDFEEDEDLEKEDDLDGFKIG